MLLDKTHHSVYFIFRELLKIKNGGIMNAENNANFDKLESQCRKCHHNHTHCEYNPHHNEYEIDLRLFVQDEKGECKYATPLVEGYPYKENGNLLGVAS